MERGRIQGLPKFFEYPLLSQERVKLRTSTFVRTLLVSIGTSLLQISGKVAGCLVRTLKTFQGTHILGGSRGLLCDSSAVFLNAVSGHWSHRTSTRQTVQAKIIERAVFGSTVPDVNLNACVAIIIILTEAVRPDVYMLVCIIQSRRVTFRRL